MFWEEKIDHLKKSFTPEQFRVPFSDAISILKKIEAKFIVRTDSQYRITAWADNLKDNVRQVIREESDKEIARLDANTNYWVIIVLGKYTEANHYVYDCQSAAIKALVSMAPAGFYIGDKKYQWLTYFEVNLIG
ncbi:MAG TPA: hypothetical protein VGS79_01360 [Puia sp.]|nr:hypothetical protein [Puia sp.]